jgi:hypothetical protein
MLTVKNDTYLPSTVVLWRWYQNPNLVSFKIFKFLMHGINPVQIRKSISNIPWFKRRDKSRMSEMINLM